MRLVRALEVTAAWFLVHVWLPAMIFVVLSHATGDRDQGTGNRGLSAAVEYGVRAALDGHMDEMAEIQADNLEAMNARIDMLQRHLLRESGETRARLDELERWQEERTFSIDD